MKENYPKAYKEVLEILKYMPDEDVEKIPKELIQTFERKKDCNYNFSIDENQDFSNLNILDETEAIMINIFTDYWATEKQKGKIIAKQNYDKQVIEENKKRKYNVDNLFNEKHKIKQDDKEGTKDIVKYKKTLYQKLIDFIKERFNRKNKRKE